MASEPVEILDPLPFSKVIARVEAHPDFKGWGEEPEVRLVDREEVMTVCQPENKTPFEHKSYKFKFYYGITSYDSPDRIGGKSLFYDADRDVIVCEAEFIH